MKTPQFSAAVQYREHFAWVQQVLCVEGTFQPLLVVKINRGEHLPHEIALLDANAMLAGQHTTHADAKSQNISTEGLGSFQLIGLAGIEQDQRMKVSVTGVEDVGAGQAVFLR